MIDKIFDDDGNYIEVWTCKNDEISISINQNSGGDRRNDESTYFLNENELEYLIEILIESKKYLKG